MPCERAKTARWTAANPGRQRAAADARKARQAADSEYRRLWKADNPLRAKCNEVRARATRRGIPFALAPDDFTRLWKAAGDPCPICDTPMLAGTRHKRSIDRIDSSLGYTPANAWAICYRCNTAKNDLTGAELLRLAQAVLAAEARLRRAVE